jgi:ribonuclease J
MLRARIHRGAAVIGGSCVEVDHDGSRIVLDLGLPLDAADTGTVALPRVAGLESGDDTSLLGIVVSHGHPDHVGLVSAASSSVPHFIGEAAARILSEAAFFTRSGGDVQPTGFLHDRRLLELGPFRITPFLADHSAFDAYSLLVEAGGRRLFYSGDLRGHGRKASVFECLLANPPAVDTLLLEGTRVSTAGLEGRGLSDERAVEAAALGVFRETDGMVLALYSAQNIDRLVSMYRAAKRAGREFVIDLSTAAIAAATGKTTIPQASWDGVRVFVPLSQRIRVKQRGEFDRVKHLGKSRIYKEELSRQPGRFVLTFRASMMDEIERASCLAGAAAVWSMWAGYLESPAGMRLRAWLERLAIPLTLAHTSGHATVADLQRLVAAMHPERVVPIHTAAPELFSDHFGTSVKLHPDGEWWTV